MIVNMAAKIERKTTERERPLMEATLRIIGRTGLDGVTHRAVATEAGMSLGAVTHHFATRDVLVDAALRFALAREVDRLRALALSLQSKALDVEAWIEFPCGLVLQGTSKSVRDTYCLLRGVPGGGQERTASAHCCRVVRDLATKRGTCSKGGRLV